MTSPSAVALSNRPEVLLKLVEGTCIDRPESNKLLFEGKLASELKSKEFNMNAV